MSRLGVLGVPPPPREQVSQSRVPNTRTPAVLKNATVHRNSNICPTRISTATLPGDGVPRTITRQAQDTDPPGTPLARPTPGASMFLFSDVTLTCSSGRPLPWKSIYFICARTTRTAYQQNGGCTTVLYLVDSGHTVDHQQRSVRSAPLCWLISPHDQVNLPDSRAGSVIPKADLGSNTIHIMTLPQPLPS